MGDNMDIQETTKQDESVAFIILTAFLVPLIAVVLVASFGMLMWLSQGLSS